jgi:hypothetical protein
MEKILNISNIIQSKNTEDLTIYGEIMLCAENFQMVLQKIELQKKPQTINLTILQKQ